MKEAVNTSAPLEQASCEERWKSCKEFFRDNVPVEQYDAFFACMSFSSFDGRNLVITVPHQGIREFLEVNHNRMLKAAFKKVFGPDTQLYYQFMQVDGQPDTSVTMLSENPSAAVKPGKDATANPFYRGKPAEIDSQLNPSYTFDNYCLSESNMVARSIGQAIADNPKTQTFNPCFIFGPTGVGKTHLIQAIGIRIKELRPETRVLYITARLFESQFTTASVSGKVNDFISFYQSIDVLIIDDIQDLIGKKPATQSAFFHIFNHLHQNQKQLIMSSDVRPSLMEGMEERMLSRFKWGVTAELSKPDLKLRRQVLSKKAQQDGLILPPDVMEFIATNATDSIREIEGIVASMMAHATFMGKPLDIDLARQVLGNSVRLARKSVNFEAITREVTSYFNIDQTKIFEKSRKREISDARQVVMFLAKKHAKMPLTTIGSRLSRSHATVLHACKNIEERMECEKQLRDDIAKIEASLL